MPEAVIDNKAISMIGTSEENYSHKNDQTI